MPIIELTLLVAILGLVGFLAKVTSPDTGEELEVLCKEHSGILVRKTDGFACVKEIILLPETEKN